MPYHVADSFFRPGSGLVDGSRAFTLREDEFAILQNVRQFSGNVVSRGGSVAQGSSLGSSAVTWIFHAYGTNVSDALVVRLAFCGTIIKYKIGSGAWTNLKTGLTAGTFPVAVPWKNHVYWCDGVNTPQDITIANPPTVADWTSFPSGINPTWVVLHLQKLKYGGDLSTPNYYYQTDFGTANTTGTTSFYLQPDDQNGNYPKVAVTNRGRVAMFCQDFLVAHTGAGPGSDQFFPMPRGAACTARRTVVDMGEFGVFFLTENGVNAWDVNSPPEPIDPFNRINTQNIDLTTEDSVHACRVGDIYRIFYKSKGDFTKSTATAASILASSTARTRFSYAALARNYITRTPFVASGNTNYYYDYNCRLKQWSGPHSVGSGGVTGYLCAAWTQYRYGDTQDLWVGDATTGGVVEIMDQQSVFTDNASPFVRIIRTGAIGSRYRKCVIRRVIAKFGVLYAADAKVTINVLQNGSDSPCATHDASLNFKSFIGTDSGASNQRVEMEDFVQVEFVPNYNGRPVGLEPQIEFRYAGGEAFELRGYEVEFEEVR